MFKTRRRLQRELRDATQELEWLRSENKRLVAELFKVG